MKTLSVLAVLSIVLSSCARPIPTVYYSSAIEPHKATAVQTRLTPIGGDESAEVGVFAGLDKVKDSNIYYVLIAPMYHFNNATKHGKNNIDIEYGASLMPEDAKELIKTLDAIDAASRSSDTRPTFIRFTSNVIGSVRPSKIAANDMGHVAIEVESIATSVWLTNIEVQFTKTATESWTKLTLNNDGSDSFYFTGQAQLIGFRDRINQALAELNSQGMALH
jgi:hypothetical protein